MPRDCKKVTTNSITNIDYTKKYTSLNEAILLHDTVIEGKLEVDGKVKVDGKLDVEGKLSLEGKLEVSGLSDLNDVTINETLSVLQDTTLHNTLIDGDLSVSGITKLHNFSFDGSMNIANLNIVNLTVSGISNLKNTVVDDSLNAVSLSVSGTSNLKNTRIDGSLNAVNLAVSGTSNLKNTRIDGSLNLINLTVSGNTNLKNTRIDSSLNIINLIFPDNTIQTTAYIPNNNINVVPKVLPSFYGNVFLNTEISINTPSIIFNNFSTFANKSVIIQFRIFVESNNSDNCNQVSNYFGYIRFSPSLVDNGSIVNKMKMPYTYNKSISTYTNINHEKDNKKTYEISDVFICTSKNMNDNNVKLFLRLDKNDTLDKTYYINVSIISCFPDNINNISIQNTQSNNFAVYS